MYKNGVGPPPGYKQTTQVKVRCMEQMISLGSPIEPIPL